MAELCRPDGSRPRRLLNQHLIGRAPECALRLTGSYVSGQHALIRWQGSIWELVDKGSRNGTRLNGEPIEPGRPYRLNKGATVSFGHVDESWLFRDASEPEVMLVALDDGEVLSGAQGIIGFPSNKDPECTFFRDFDGSWKVELADGTTRPVTDGETFESSKRLFRLSLPTLAMATASVLQEGGGRSTGAESPALRFGVSSDEEFVELELVYAQHKVSLGSRSHNYLLLTLARSYLSDVESGLPEASCGWMDKEQLAAGLRTSPEQIDGDVFRVRKHFARHGLPEAAVVIERRPRTRQIRLGLRNVRIERP